MTLPSVTAASIDPRPSIAALLTDPAVRRPLKEVLRSWARRDPLDAIEDANLLALALERRADEWTDPTPRPPRRHIPQEG